MWESVVAVVAAVEEAVAVVVVVVVAAEEVAVEGSVVGAFAAAAAVDALDKVGGAPGQVVVVAVQCWGAPAPALSVPGHWGQGGWRPA